MRRLNLMTRILRARPWTTTSPVTRTAVNPRRADGHVAALADHQHPVEDHLVTRFPIETLQAHHLAFNDPVLLAAAFEDREHGMNSYSA